MTSAQPINLSEEQHEYRRVVRQFCEDKIAPLAAETDATKRALATFGNPFGLALYDRELAGVRNRKALEFARAPAPTAWALRTAKGDAKSSFEKPEEFTQALRQAMTGAGDIELLFAIWEQNLDTVRILNRCLKQRPNSPSPAQHLVAHLKQCAVNLTKPADATEPSQAISSRANGHPPRIDKSVVALSEPKRLRSKEHLRSVARQPCLICGRMPSQAHHIRYAHREACPESER